MTTEKILKTVYYLMALILLLHGLYEVLTIRLNPSLLAYPLIEIGIGLILLKQAKKP